jgi:hypothetical protein
MLRERSAPVPDVGKGTWEWVARQLADLGVDDDDEEEEVTR